MSKIFTHATERWTYTSWHRWYAWKPVTTIDNRWTWLRVVHRRFAYAKSEYASSEQIAAGPVAEYLRYDGYV